VRSAKHQNMKLSSGLPWQKHHSTRRFFSPANWT